MIFVGTLLAASACTGNPPSLNSTPAQPSVAVLQAVGTSSPTLWNTVLITGLDRRFRASASFTPLPIPDVGCAGPVLPQSAHVAAGKVYFADGEGVIRSLAPDGKLDEVTRFPLESRQQMLSFAISPDGTRLLAGIFSLAPRRITSSDPCMSGESPFGPQTFTLDVYSARSGSSARLLYHQDLGTFTDTRIMQLLSFIGWDAIGPLATDPTGWASQGGGPWHWPGSVARVDPTTGRVVKPVDPTNWVWDMGASGDYVCVDAGSSISVRRPDGSEIWRVPADPTKALGYEYVLMSTDEKHVAIISGWVFGRDGSSVQLPPDFSYAGWVDGSTLISGDLNKNLSYLSLAAPSRVVDLGFKGTFIGTLQS